MVTPELENCTEAFIVCAGVRGYQVGAVKLIAVVTAVISAVTFPNHGNTHLMCMALEVFM